MDTCVTTPYIIKETSSGMFVYSIQDDMLLNREIECVGEINADSVNSLIRQIRHLARQDPEGEISIYINSPGGQVSSGLALYDVMKAVPCPIRTVCVGTAASMAAVLFAAGDRRDMLPHANVMLHDPRVYSCPGGSALEIRSMSDSLMQIRENIARLIAERTGRTLDEIYEKTAQDTWFTAQQAVDFGLADRIIHTI